ncbi:MAG: recombinase family protein [Umezawaea sp.]
MFSSYNDAEREWKAVRYLRISDLTDTSTSIPRQDKETAKRVSQLNGRVVATFSDVDKSGFHTHVHRPDWDKAQAAIRAGVGDLLIVFKVDRATRQGIPQAAEIIKLVYETECRFVSALDGIDSNNPGWELSLIILADQAHKESKNTSGRVAHMRADERDHGRWMGPRPYGSIVTPERKLIRHPVEADRIAEMLAMWMAGKSFRAIARYANAQGWDCPRYAVRKHRIAELESKKEPLKAQKLRDKPIKTPNTWSSTPIINLLLSATMVGYLPHEGTLYRHSVTGEPLRAYVEDSEPPLSISDWATYKMVHGERVPSHFERSVTPGSRSQTTKREARVLLIDFLYCWECGSRMICDDMIKYPRYRCEQRSRGKRCPGVSVNVQGAERIIVPQVLDRIGALEPDDPSIIAIAERWADQQHPDRAQRRTELERLISEEDKFIAQLEDEKLRGDMFKGDRGEKRFKAKHAAAESRLAQYDKELAEITPESRPLDVSFLHQLELVREAWGESPLNEQREFLSLVLNRVYVNKSGHQGERPHLGRFKFWYPGEPEPEGVGALGKPEDEDVPTFAEAHDLYETADQSSRVVHEERAGEYVEIG